MRLVAVKALDCSHDERLSEQRCFALLRVASVGGIGISLLISLSELALARTFDAWSLARLTLELVALAAFIGLDWKRSKPVGESAPVEVESVAKYEREAVLEHALDGVAEISQSGRIVSANHSFAQLAHRSDEEMTGLQWTEVIHPDDLDVVTNALQEIGPKKTRTVDCRTFSPFGKEEWCSLTVAMIQLKDNTPPRMFWFAQNTTQRRKYELELEDQILINNENQLLLQLRQEELEDLNCRLERLATTDGLTGLFNHRSFQEQMDHMLRKDLPFAIALLDVDKFKTYNDEYGHPAGDAVLVKVGQILRDSVGTDDFAARYGGEEFAIILPGATANAAMSRLDLVRRRLEEAEWPNRTVTASFGCTFWRPGASKAELISEADQALYLSKEGGRNRVTQFELAKVA